MTKKEHTDRNARNDENIQIRLEAEIKVKEKVKEKTRNVQIASVDLGAS